MIRFAGLAALAVAAGMASGCSPEVAADEATCQLSAASAADAEAAKAGCGREWVDMNVRLNQAQAIGSHNSYKVAIPDVELAVIAGRNADAAVTLDYSHRPLAEQLDRGARQFEFDPSDDPQGGLFADPLMRRLLASQGTAGPDYDLSAMRQPGIKVIHVADIDYRSHCLLFTDCLKQVKAWSDAHRDHSPILLMINPKSSGVPWEGAATVLPWGRDAYERMDAEIRSVFPVDRIVTPDDVRGDHATLREAVLAGGWPTMGEARGRVIFAIDLSPEATAPYADGHPSLEGRLAFINTDADAPEAAYFTMNEPSRDLALIQERVKQGFLVRTRADADTREARTGDRARLEAALASGAQFISTDYQWPDERFGTGYEVALPDGSTVRCNPVNAPSGCGPAAVE